MVGNWLVEIVRNMVCVQYMAKTPYIKALKRANGLRIKENASSNLNHD